jgi:superkiller protein 3
MSENVRELIEKGNALFKLGSNEEAIAYYDKALKIKPKYHHAWDKKGHALRNLNKFEEAIACCEKVIKIKPDFYFAWHNKGNVLGELERYDEALLWGASQFCQNPKIKRF